MSSLHHEDAAEPGPEVELLLATPLSVVVRARIEFGDGSSLDAGLVVARSQCRGERPSAQALLLAARRRLAGLRRSIRRAKAGCRLLVCANGAWLTLIEREPVPPQPPSTPTAKGNDLMNTTTPRHALFRALAGASLAVLVCGGASAGTAEANYRKERADCLTGRSPQDRQTCLREAAASLQEARRGGLSSPSAQVLAENALARCQRQPVADRADCERLVRGEGVQSGTVAQGAVVREVVTLKVEPPAAGAVEPKR